MRIGDVAARTGMSASALRAWEERYGVLQPRRTTGGHRQYGEEDVGRVMAVRALVAAGHTVASAARELAAPASGKAAVRYSSLAAVYAATRAVLAAEEPAAVVAAVEAFVRALDGRLVPATEATGDCIPIDVALAEGPPVLAAAEPATVARLELERLLPALVDDARMALARLHLDRRRA